MNNLDQKQLDALEPQLLFTYLMHRAGINPRTKISRSQYFLHKKLFANLYNINFDHPIPDHQRTKQTPPPSVPVSLADSNCGTHETQDTLINLEQSI